MRNVSIHIFTVFVVFVLMASGSIVCAEEQKTAPSGKQLPAMKSSEMPSKKVQEMKQKTQTVPELPKTGAAKREAINANFNVVGITGATAGVIDNNNRIVTNANHSVIIINGWIELGDMKYNGAYPLFQMPHIVFPDAPKTCRIVNGWFPQPKYYVMRYRYNFTFEDTATKPECWNYFIKLDKLRLNIQKVKVKINNPWEKGQEMDIVGAGIMEFTMSPIKQKNPSGD